jgi:hypothetical protein
MDEVIVSASRNKKDAEAIRELALQVKKLTYIQSKRIKSDFLFVGTKLWLSEVRLKTFVAGELWKTLAILGVHYPDDFETVVSLSSRVLPLLMLIDGVLGTKGPKKAQISNDNLAGFASKGDRCVLLDSFTQGFRELDFGIKNLKEHGCSVKLVLTLYAEDEAMGRFYRATGIPIYSLFSPQDMEINPKNRMTPYG